jgi:RimJ/RimL family protein N-acetyltransferase
MIEFQHVDMSNVSLLEEWMCDAEFKKRIGGYDSVPGFMKYVIETPGRFMWIAYENSNPIGEFDVEIDELEAWIAIGVNPSLRGKGYGTKIAAIVLFSNTGFVQNGEIDEEGFLHLERGRH